MPEILYQSAIVALSAAFIILFLNKTGLRIKFRDYNDKIGISIVADMLDCDFCLSFWTCFALTIGFWTFGWEPHFIVAFCAAPVTRFLL